jgi:hypothetical protein
VSPGAVTLHVAPYTIEPVDAGSFSTHGISPIRHTFQTHPLMQLARLARLAHDLMPRKQCRFIRPNSTQASSFHHDDTSPDGRDIDEVFRRIEEPGSWIALYQVESDPEYRTFLESVVDCARPMIEREQPGIFNINGFIFISAPPSVTPFHIDRENNLWLQIRGRKTIHVWDHRDRESVSARAVEDFIVHRDLSRVRLSDAIAARGHPFEVAPGDGVYFPATSPHMTSTVRDWVAPGDGVSISIGVVFYSRTTRRDAQVHQWNRVLRRIGLEPAPPRQSPWRDAVKAPLGRAAAIVSRRLRGYEPPPGSY